MSFVKWFYGKAKSYISMKISIKKMAWTDLEVSGDSSREIYEELFKTKIKGKDYIDTQKNIALLSVPLSYDDYIRGKAKQALRTNINKASKKDTIVNILMALIILMTLCRLIVALTLGEDERWKNDTQTDQ